MAAPVFPPDPILNGQTPPSTGLLKPRNGLRRRGAIRPKAPVEIAALYSAVERMRLASSAEVIVTAETVIRQIAEAYAAPDRTFDDLRQSLRDGELMDPIRDFSEACRKELNTLPT